MLVLFVIIKLQDAPNISIHRGNYHFLYIYLFFDKQLYFTHILYMIDISLKTQTEMSL